jgi:hypothetical protein
MEAAANLKPPVRSMAASAERAISPTKANDAHPLLDLGEFSPGLRQMVMSPPAPRQADRTPQKGDVPDLKELLENAAQLSKEKTFWNWVAATGLVVGFVSALPAVEAAVPFWIFSAALTMIVGGQYLGTDRWTRLNEIQEKIEALTGTKGKRSSMPLWKRLL